MDGDCATRYRGALAKALSLVYVANFIAGLIGAVIGLGGVFVGSWLQGRKEHQGWLRDQKLRAAVGFIGAMGDIHDLRRRSAGTEVAVEQDAWARAQDARSALYLLCDPGTVQAAEDLIQGVKHTVPKGTSPDDDETIALLREVVQ